VTLSSVLIVVSQTAALTSPGQHCHEFHKQLEA